MPTSGWHLRREVSFGHIISTIMLAILLVSGWVHVQTQMRIFEDHITAPAHPAADRRMDLLESAVGQIQITDSNLVNRINSVDSQVSNRLDAMQSEIIRRLERIEDRLNQHSASDNGVNHQ